MGTFILGCFILFVLSLTAKLIYEVQQNKKSIKIQQNEITADEVNVFQTLAGIKGEQTHSLSVDELKKEFENTEFPAPDPSIPVITAKLTTIGGNYADSDPLASVPMSRVSDEAKQKMAEIAKQDISVQLEQNAEKFATLIKSDKPKTKKKNPKQDIKGIVDETKPFKKTRKKATKTKKENE
jgi:hypothetical protein